jgi:hypothetical protein
LAGQEEAEESEEMEVVPDESEEVEIVQEESEKSEKEGEQQQKVEFSLEQCRLELGENSTSEIFWMLHQ